MITHKVIVECLSFFRATMSEIFNLKLCLSIQPQSQVNTHKSFFRANKSAVFELYNLRASSQIRAKWPEAQSTSICHFSHVNNKARSSSWGNTPLLVLKTPPSEAESTATQHRADTFKQVLLSNSSTEHSLFLQPYDLWITTYWTELLTNLTAWQI